MLGEEAKLNFKAALSDPKGPWSWTVLQEEDFVPLR